MSRSKKKAIVRISNKMQCNVHGAVRQKITNQLAQIDKEPDGLTLLDIEADTKEMGLWDYGTVFGLEFCDEEDWQEDKIRFARK